MDKLILEDNLPNGTVQKREIKKITEKETKDYRLLGQGFGQSFNFCLYLGHKHCHNFRKRLAAFRILKRNKISEMMEDATGKEFEAVEFYEKK